MIRIFLGPLSGDESAITLDPQNSHYVRDVLRCTEGDPVAVFDGSGAELICRVRSAGNPVVLAVEGRSSPRAIPSRRITVGQGMLKGAKMDLVVQKLSEIGVSALVPVCMERSQVRETAKVPRWRKIAAEASRQCGRADVMEVRAAASLDEFLSELSTEGDDQVRLLFYEGGGSDLRVFEESIRSAGSIVLSVGPEGGVAADEVARFRRAGFQLVGLGGAILRAETASIVSAGLVQYIAGHFSGLR